MTSKEQMFRVFRCPHCGYTGYRLVSDPDADSTCNLCSKTISPSPEMRYVTSVEDARQAMSRIVFEFRNREKPKPRHGIGVKKRILYMVSDLSDLNQGCGVSRSRVLEECEEVDIDVDKARHFLAQLEDEGKIQQVNGLLVAVQEDEF